MQQCADSLHARHWALLTKPSHIDFRKISFVFGLCPLVACVSRNSTNSRIVNLVCAGKGWLSPKIQSILGLHVVITSTVNTHSFCQNRASYRAARTYCHTFVAIAENTEQNPAASYPRREPPPHSDVTKIWKSLAFVSEFSFAPYKTDPPITAIS
jgi:hypothetical protein